MDATARTSPAAVVSLVSGILGWFVIPIIGPVVAIASGHFALDRIRRSGGLETGRRIALAGLVLGWVQIVLVAVGFAVWLITLIVAGAVGGLAVVAVVLLVLSFAAAAAVLISLLFSGFS
ncbi:MAG: DUF4190 domain-containing protein [Candidatus Wenzhouxiangella sp. M2_3B_020]